MLGLHPPKRPTRTRDDVTLLLDADYLSYMIPSLCQHRDRPANKDVRRVCVDEEREVYVWVEPFHHVKFLLERQLDQLKDKFRTDNLEIWMTPKAGNFREQVAGSSGHTGSKPYKGQRTAVKPFYHKHTREFMIDGLKANMADRCEADDMVCTRQMQLMSEGGISVIVGPDKDLRNMFGYLFNPQRGKENLEWITDDMAAYHFYCQMVTGDRADNIPGIPGTGKAALAKMERQAQGSWMRLEELVAQEYQKRGLPFEFFIEQGTLLHMRRRLYESWSDDYDFGAGYNEDTKGGLEWTSYHSTGSR